MQPLRPIIFHPGVPEIVLIDQTALPGSFHEITVTDIGTLADAILKLVVRGAPALGIAGASGMALAARISTTSDHQAFLREMEETAAVLRSTRPTAVNLFYGIDQVLAAILRAGTRKEAVESACTEAVRIAEEDRETCHAIGRNALPVIPDTAVILTHCNAGALACAEWGTALGVIRTAVFEGRKIRVYACETRPLLQGARLTSWELARDGIDVTVITDSMAAYLMQQKKIDLVVVGADRVVSDGVFNKIGTYMHAVCARYHDIPFYVAAPLSTFDEMSTMSEIIVEERNRDEIARCGDRVFIADGIPVYNPAFDATPAGLVTGIITEHGIFRLPEDLPAICMARSRNNGGT